MTSGFDCVLRFPGPGQRAEAPPLPQRATPHRGEFDGLALAEAELDAPAEEHASGNVVAAANVCGIGARLLRFHHDCALFLGREAAPT